MFLLRETNERERAGRLTKTHAQEVQQACGLRFNPFGFLDSDALRSNFSLIGAVTYDWVHTFFQDGIFVLEASLMVKACGDRSEVMLGDHVQWLAIERLLNRSRGGTTATCCTLVGGTAACDGARPRCKSTNAALVPGLLRHAENRSAPSWQTMRGSSPGSAV